MRNRFRTLAVAGAAVASLLGASSASAQEKYALSMFHFNAQYVAGGMVGYWSTPNPAIDLDEAQIEDLIVTESLAPVVELYQKHPTWGFNLEMQGYLLDILAARHPALLDTMRAMAKAGQLDIISFHYSDQLFIAYPQDDWERSQALSAATFAAHDVPLSKSVFCQEGQAGVAMGPAMKARGYRTLVWPKNLWSYQHGDFDAQPLYKFGDVFMIAGAKGVSYQKDGIDITTTWTFFDDGELLATGDLNPYFPDVFKVKPEAVAAYEAELSSLEKDGYAITTIEKYVDGVKDKVPLADPPPLLDGTWQPNSTEGVLRWLGGRGIWGADERDNDVRTLGAMAHRELVAAEAIAKEAGINRDLELAGAFRLLFLGQVSDASGINPFRGEVEYGVAHFTEALRVARDVINDAKEAMGAQSVVIDPGASPAATLGAEDVFAGSPSEAPIKLVISPDGREVHESWEEIGPGHHRVTIAFGPGESTFVSVTFPGTSGAPIETTMALDDAALASLPRENFSFDHYYLALPIGIIGLGGGRYVIKDQARTHLAAEVFKDSGDVVFRDDTSPAFEPATWVFHVFSGSAEEALSLASRINGKRRLSR